MYFEETRVFQTVIYVPHCDFQRSRAWQRNLILASEAFATAISNCSSPGMWGSGWIFLSRNSRMVRSSLLSTLKPIVSTSSKSSVRKVTIVVLPSVSSMNLSGSPPSPRLSDTIPPSPMYDLSWSKLFLTTKRCGQCPRWRVGSGIGQSGELQPNEFHPDANHRRCQHRTAQSTVLHWFQMHSWKTRLQDHRQPVTKRLHLEPKGNRGSRKQFWLKTPTPSTGIQNPVQTSLFGRAIWPTCRTNPRNNCRHIS